MVRIIVHSVCRLAGSRSVTGSPDRFPRLRGLVCLAVGLGAFACVGACRGGSAMPERMHVRIATGSPGGGFYPLGAALATELARTLPHVDVSTQPSAGA